MLEYFPLAHRYDVNQILLFLLNMHEQLYILQNLKCRMINNGLHDKITINTTLAFFFFTFKPLFYFYQQTKKCNSHLHAPDTSEKRSYQGPFYLMGPNCVVSIHHLFTCNITLVTFHSYSVQPVCTTCLYIENVL